MLKAFPNEYADRDYEITLRCTEFTSVCPRTGQPDFGQLHITYVPDKLCLDQQSLKFYIQSYREQGIFYEHVTNKILDDLVDACSPRRTKVVGDFSVRGGIKTVVTVTYDRFDDGR
jgi:7-cyano-7-deazaguanine reductase